METKATPIAKAPKRRFSLGSGPAADWKLIFLCGVLLLIAFAAIDALIFVRFRSEEPAAASSDGSRTLDLDALRKTTSYYQNKKAQFDKIVGGTATGTIPADPSL